jgi:hypothetical protein
LDRLISRSGDVSGDNVEYAFGISWWEDYLFERFSHPSAYQIWIKSWKLFAT